jgi:hypothetical protein
MLINSKEFESELFHNILENYWHVVEGGGMPAVLDSVLLTAALSWMFGAWCPYHWICME